MTCGARYRADPKALEEIFQKYKIHRFYNRTAGRVLRIASDITSRYGGDARRIWRGQPTDEVRRRLEEIGAGPQITNMIVMALLDCGQISGKGGLKSDSNVRKVLGRVFKGKLASVDEAVALADKMVPGNSRIIDHSIYTLGRYVCTGRNPKCGECPLSEACLYNRTRSAGHR